MRVAALAVLAVVLVGCSGAPNGPMPHTSAEEKAIASYNNLTPQQQIAFVQNGKMPEGAKEATIAKIKAKYGLK